MNIPTEHPVALDIGAPLPPPPAPEPVRIQVNWVHLFMWFGLILLFFMFLRAVRPILLPFALGMMVAYLMDPIADRLSHHGMRRNLAAALITLVLFTSLTALIVWLGPLLYNQSVELFSKVPGFLKQVENTLQHDAAPLLKTLNSLSGNKEQGSALPSSISDMLQNSLSSMTGIVTNILASAATLLNVLALLLITPIVCFYLIRDWPGVLQRADHLLPLVYAPMIREQLHLINKTLAAYVRGQITVVAILVAYYGIAFTLLGVNYSLLLALLAGVMVVIPYIGPMLAVTIGLIVGYGQFGMETDWWIMVGAYAFGNIFEGNYLTPTVIGDRVGLHPLWMLFGMLAGAVLFGFVGVLLAVPLTAAISVLVKFAVARYLESTLYTQA